MSDYSNCLFFVLKIYFKRKFRGKIRIRKSRWGYFPHFLYIERKHIVQYTPINPKLKICPPPVFKGKVKWGDKDEKH